MKNKTKVEIWGVYPPPVGGISAYCNRLAGALHVMDESVILKNFARSRSRCDYVKDVRCRLLEILKLPFVSRRIIHVQFCNVWFLTSLYLTGWRHDIVITLHNRKLLLLKGWKERIVRRFLSRARAVIFNDPGYCDMLHDKYGLDKSVMTVLPTYIPSSESEKRGIPDEIESFCSRFRYIISTNAHKVTLNSWGDVYGFDQIIGMMDILTHRRGLDVGVVFLIATIDNNEYYNECRKRIEELGLSERFLFVVGSDVNGFEVWERSDLFVRATLTDMEGISVKESLQYGTPVVASDVCTRPEQAVLYRKGDVQDLSMKCADILESGLKQVEYHPETDVPERIFDIYCRISE
ncbi:MAG: glycosyltransferase [Bacteroidaceae bacterium]|nr:glycosyltransferase [Bacteroidaceae bacterium]